MADNFQKKVETIDTVILEEVIRHDQNSASFEITKWSVKRLSDKGIMNPDGLWLFSGEGYDETGSRHWSVVLKFLTRQENMPPLDNMWHWKRELFVARSGLIENLSDTLRAPRIYKAEETTEGAWLWLENIENSRPGSWGADDYVFVAHELGYWNGKWAHENHLPKEPWLTQKHHRSWYPETDPEKDFQFPLNQKHIYGSLLARYEKLWAEREIFYRVVEALPQFFSHFDSQRRNLFIRKGDDGQDEVILIDWGQCGLGPLGAELNFLVPMSAALGEWPTSRLAELDAITFDSYLKGLVDAGWSGNADIVRLGYATWVSVWFGVVFPNLTALWCTPQFRPYALKFIGLVEEELFHYFLPLFNYSLECADEARALMKKLGFHEF